MQRPTIRLPRQRNGVDRRIVWGLHGTPFERILFRFCGKPPHSRRVPLHGPNGSTAFTTTSDSNILFSELPLLPLTHVREFFPAHCAKYLRFCGEQAHLSRHPLEFFNALYPMDRLETLALDCLPVSLEGIFSILDNVAFCPLFRTLIVRLPRGVAADAEEGSLLNVIRRRAESGGPIRRLRAIVSPKEHIPMYSQIFKPFLQEVEILVCQKGVGNRAPWLVWED